MGQTSPRENRRFFRPRCRGWSHKGGEAARQSDSCPRQPHSWIRGWSPGKAAIEQRWPLVHCSDKEQFPPLFLPKRASGPVPGDKARPLGHFRMVVDRRATVCNAVGSPCSLVRSAEAGLRPPPLDMFSGATDSAGQRET
jgi:hypothetical protein